MNTANTQDRSSNKLVVPGARQAIDQMKFEIFNEFGVNLGRNKFKNEWLSWWRN